MLSFKHHLAAAFVVGSLLSVTQTSPVNVRDYVNVNNLSKEAFAVGAAAVVWIAATHHTKLDADGKAIVQKGLCALIDKARAAAHPYVLAIPRFADQNKHAIQATTAAYIVARYGKSAFNSIKDGLKFHNMKQNFPNAWINVPAEEKTAQAA